MRCSILTGGQFHKYFTRVTNSLGKISFTIHCIHATVQGFQKVPAYFAMAVSYALKMFMESTPGMMGLWLSFSP
jgi:hypothetical protein